MVDKKADAKHAAAHADAHAHAEHAAATHAADAKHTDATPAAKAAPVYDGPDRRVSLIADRRSATPAPWPPVKFPAWRYHATEGSKVVASQAEADALGAGWSADGPIVVTPPGRG
jgi:hypothetical protein